MERTTTWMFLAFCLSIPLYADSCTEAQMQTKWDLWQKGNCLRGANIWQVINDKKEYGNTLGDKPVGPPFSLAILQELRRWGANYVNISHPGLFTQDPPYVLDKNVQQNLDSLLELIAQANLYAVISFRTGPGRTEKAFAHPSPNSANQVWKSRAAQNAWAKMWEVTARLYNNHPEVIGYDLMVEPNSNATVLNEWDPESFYSKYGGTLYDWYPLAENIRKSIRKVDSQTPLLVSAMNWGDVSWLPYFHLLNDTKTAYVIHQYEPFVYTHQTAPYQFVYPGYFDGNYDGIAENIDKTWLRNMLIPAETFRKKNQVPVAVMEYGLKHRVPNSAQFLQDQLSVFESAQVNHAIWLWETDYSGVDWDDFNVRAAADPAFPNALKSNWSNNTIYFSESSSSKKKVIASEAKQSRNQQ